MDLMYFKRYRMEITLAGRDLAPPRAPEGYRFEAVEPGLAGRLCRGQVSELSRRDRRQCLPLPGRIGRLPPLDAGDRPQAGLPAGNDLASDLRPRLPKRPEFCGTVQGIRDVSGLGAIQNLGIAPEHRNGGLGTILLFYALQGFRRAGIGRVYLEVTAQNEGALRLYRRLGFVTVKTVYKAVEHVYS